MQLEGCVCFHFLSLHCQGQLAALPLIQLCVRDLEAQHSSLELNSWVVLEQNIFLPVEVHSYSMLSFSIYIASSHAVFLHINNILRSNLARSKVYTFQILSLIIFLHMHTPM